MRRSPEIRSWDSESNGGFNSQHAMESPEGDGRATVTSTLHQQNDLIHHQGTNENLSEENRSSNSHSVIQMGSAEDEHSTASSHHQDHRRTCQNLYKAAKEGKWKGAKEILERNQNLVSADLTNRRETILHVATQANRNDFVRQLLEYLKGHMNGDQINRYLELPDARNNTAFLFAAASGNVKIVDEMVERNPSLRTKTGQDSTLTPVHIAALFGKGEMAQHLYKGTDEVEYGDDGLKLLLFLCVNAGIYDLALRLLKEKPVLAFARDPNNETVLHILTRKPLGLKQDELVTYLWNDIFLTRQHKDIIENISGGSHVAFNAVKVGNFKFLGLLISTFPYLRWEVDERGRSMIHIAVLNRQADIFNFARELGSIKDLIAYYRDAHDGRNLLHMAATLPSKDRLNLVSGAAFQMTLELLWFEEVKKMVPPSFIEMKDRNNLTPHELFTVEHKELMDKAESWTEKTTNYCLLVSSLITTGVFTATFSIPGGTEDDAGSPHYLVNQRMWFIIFSIFDAIAMISSSTSIFIFFSILISRHDQYDFQYKSLAMKLMFGLITLLTSILSMMISFSSAFIMYFNSNHNGLKWVPIFIYVLAFISTAIFLLLIWPLWSDIKKLTKFRWNISSHGKICCTGKLSSC